MEAKTTTMEHIFATTLNKIMIKLPQLMGDLIECNDLPSTVIEYSAESINW
jgi:hypothetical protein